MQKYVSRFIPFKIKTQKPFNPSYLIIIIYSIIIILFIFLTIYATFKLN